MRAYYDLHIHSCLSPCGDADMTPNNIVGMAKLKGLDVIAVSDHNSALNLPAVMAVAEANDLLVIPAIEANTAEEVHVLCLFESLEGALGFSDLLYEHLPPILNDPAVFGAQQIMDTQDRVIGTVDKLLINAADLSIDDLLREIVPFGGVCIPAHVDKNAYSITAALGYIPPEYGFSCIEVKSPPFDTDFAGHVITDSDAHYLEHIAERERFLEVDALSVRGVLDALRSF